MATNDSSSQNNLSGSNQLVPGSLGGTPEKPVQQCSNNNCALDFGEFILTGVPEGFGELVQTTGSSGGIESIFSLMDQIAAQLEQNGDTEGAKEYRDLANLGHFQADLTKEVEELVKSNYCSVYYNASGCFKSLSNKEFLYTSATPDSIAEYLPDRPSTIGGWMGITAESLYSVPAKALYEKLSPDSTTYNKYAANKTRYPAYAMVDLFNSIMNNDKYSDTLKGVTTKLYQNSNDLLFNNSVVVLSAAGYTNSLPKYDPITGNSLGTVSDYTASFNEIIAPKTSLNTDIKSALVCVIGKNHDNGSECKK